MNDLSTAPTKQPPAAFDAPIGWLRNEIDRLFDDFRRPMRSVFNFAPVDFHHRKFPETSAEEMAALVGLPVQKIAWNTFVVPAVKALTELRHS